MYPEPFPQLPTSPAAWHELSLRSHNAHVGKLLTLVAILLQVQSSVYTRVPLLLSIVLRAAHVFSWLAS